MIEEKTITFSANQQNLIKTGGISHYASDTICYIKAIFELGENWTDFDEIRAMFKTPYDCRPAVLNSLGECIVPREILMHKAEVRVNLVGSDYTEEAVIDRLTTYSCEALAVDEDVPVSGIESTPLSPSEYEQFVANVKADANRAEASATSAETYADNSLASAQASEASALRSANSATDSANSASQAENYATSAEQFANSAESSADEAEQAKDTILGMRAEATTLPSGSQATASYSDGVMSFGIPKGDKGNKGDAGDSAGFGSVTASVDDNTGTPSVDVTTSGTDQAKNFAFAFHNIKGAKGDKGDTGEVTLSQLYSILPTDTASGDIASFTDGADSVPMLSVVADIEPIQDLHGYDKPWSGGAGKNKWSLENSYTSSSGATIIANEAFSLPSGTYTMSFGGTMSGAMAVTFRKADLTNITQITFSASDLVSGRYVKAFTASENVEKINVYVNNAVSINDIQIESGSATDYAPYSNICPIYGHTQSVVEQRRKNLLDPKLYIGLSYNPTVGSTATPTISDEQFVDNGNGTFALTLNGTWKSRGVLIPIKGSETYYLKLSVGTSGTAFGTTRGYLDKEFKVLSKYNDTDTTQSFASALSPNTYLGDDDGYFYIVFSTRGSSESVITVTNPQLELGSTATAYEPYQGETYTTQFGQTVYGGSVDLVSGVLTVDRAMVDLGSLTWNYNSTNGYFYANVDNGVPNLGIYKMPNILCDIYKTVASMYGADFPNAENGIVTWSRDSSQVQIKNTAYTDATSFKTAMSGTQLCYELATPTTIQLTPQEIDSFKGANNLWASTGEIEVEYRADIGLYIEKKLS